jgi:hypothetical protein
MVDILISKGDNINEKNEENKEKDIKLEWCGGFNEVDQFLINQGQQIK